MMRYVYIFIACGVFIAALYTFHKSATNQAYKRGVAEQKNNQHEDFEAQLTKALEDNSKHWAQAVSDAQKVKNNQTQLREVIRETIEVPVYSPCTNLGDEWLRSANAVIAADTESAGRGEATLQ